MGRKIPGKKHRGRQTPEQQKEKRDAEIRQKVNAAPKFIDDQEIPKKLQLISRLREDTKNGKMVKQKKEKRSNLLDSSKHMGYEMRLPGMKKPLKPIPIFKQDPGEKPKLFYKRVHNQVEQFLQQKQYEEKYNVDLVQDEENGKTKFVEREKDELDEHMHQLKAKKMAKKGIVLKSKEEKRKEKRLKEKEKRLKKKRKSYKKMQEEEEEDFDDEPEKVEFNDVVQAPPSKLQGVKNNEARRPGQQKDLLLLSEQNMKVKAKVTQPAAKVKDTKAKKKFKQKMSMARQQMFEIDRNSIIEQYRAFKQQKT